MIDAPQIFLSYRRDDSAYITDRIYDRLVKDFGEKTIFRDINNIPLGANFQSEIKRRVGQCNILLAVIGPNWINITDAHGQRRLDNPKDFVRLEIESALARNIPVVPLLVQGARVPQQSELPGRLKRIVFQNGMDIRPGRDFDHDMKRLIEQVEVYLPNFKKPLATSTISSPSLAVGNNSIVQYLSNAADPKIIRKVFVAEFCCFASVLLSIWVAGFYMAPLTASLDEMILYALGCSLFFAMLLGLSNWWMRYDEYWISTFGGTTLLVVIWAFVALLF
jgi:hypothetical protein